MGLISTADIRDKLAEHGIELSKFQLSYWGRYGFIKEHPKSAERREGKRSAYRHYAPEEVEKIAYMALLINQAGLNPHKAKAFAEKLVGRDKPHNGKHWLVDGLIVVGVPHVRIMP
jgi:hypothetical protein